MVLDELIHDWEERLAEYERSGQTLHRASDELACLRAVKAELDAARAVIERSNRLAGACRQWLGSPVGSRREFAAVMSIGEALDAFCAAEVAREKGEKR